MSKNIKVKVEATIEKINEIFKRKFKRDPYVYYDDKESYYYAKILQDQFPGAKLYYIESPFLNHVTTKIGDTFYDVLGSCDVLDIEYIDESYTLIDDENHELHVKYKFYGDNFRDNNHYENVIINSDIISELNKDKELSKVYTKKLKNKI